MQSCLEDKILSTRADDIARNRCCVCGARAVGSMVKTSVSGKPLGKVKYYCGDHMVEAMDAAAKRGR